MPDNGAMTGTLFQRVLLLEDDPSHAVLIRRALSEACGAVEHVTTVAAALAAAPAEPFDLVVTDLHVPDSEGVSHVEAFCARWVDTPVVVLTSSTSLADAVAAMKLGARDFIVKNFDRDFRDVMALSLGRLSSAVNAERERRALRREMDVLRVAIENGDEGLAVVSGRGEIVYANSAFRGFFERCGGAGGELLSMFGPGIAKSDSVRRNIVDKLAHLPSGGVFTTELTPVGPGLKETAFDLSLSIVETGAPLPRGSIREAVVWIRDRTELKRRERFQRELLSTTTHDLKGPLGAIILSADLLRETAKGTPKTAELALRIGSSAQGALNLIDEFLSARRIQEGSLVLRPVEHPVADLLESTLADYTTIAAARRVTLELSDGTGVGATARVDRLGFGRVLGNLVSNALKFTPSGGRVTVSTRLKGDDLTLTVRDTGTGMEPAEVQRVFERFSRLDRHRDVAGSGLGLFVVKSVVSAHGGDIEVTSKVGEGTTIGVTFPANPPVNDRGEIISLDFAL
jgi:signal transduction histidine kinase/ActR/RegA family two-component response regulator